MRLNPIAILCVVVLLAGCDPSNKTTGDSNSETNKQTMELNAGGVYASKNEEGKFTITKILALDEFAVHARFYNEEFDALPNSISTSDLTFLIGHAPLAREGFLKDEQHLITTEDVTDAELEGYKLYLEAMRER